VLADEPGRARNHASDGDAAVHGTP
jgi:hypothetical protein